jgi:hypothetical protein
VADWGFANFGSGNANGAWTLNRNNGVELGLRAKVRFDENNSPRSIYNYDGVDSYTHLAGQMIWFTR